MRKVGNPSCLQTTVAPSLVGFWRVVHCPPTNTSTLPCSAHMHTHTHAHTHTCTHTQTQNPYMHTTLITHHKKLMCCHIQHGVCCYNMHSLPGSLPWKRISNSSVSELWRAHAAVEPLVAFPNSDSDSSIPVRNETGDSMCLLVCACMCTCMCIQYESKKLDRSNVTLK